MQRMKKKEKKFQNCARVITDYQTSGATRQKLIRLALAHHIIHIPPHRVVYRPKEFRSFPDFSSPIDRVKKWGAVGVLFPPQKVIPPVLFIFPQKRKKKTYISISLLPPVVMNDSLEPRQKSGGTAAGSGRSSSSSPAVLHNIYEEEEEEEKTRVIRSEGGQERERDILAVTTRR